MTCIFLAGRMLGGTAVSCGGPTVWDTMLKPLPYFMVKALAEVACRDARRRMSRRQRIDRRRRARTLVKMDRAD